jgi:hypothetical protein
MRRVLRLLLVMTASLSLAAAAAVPAIAGPTIAGPTIAGPTMKSQFGPAAALIARGAAVQVRAVYTCPSTGISPNMSATVTESVPGGVAQGNGLAPSTTVTCDGVQHTVQFGVATSNIFAFQAGTAFATGDLSAALPNNSSTDFSFEAVISIQ